MTRLHRQATTSSCNSYGRLGVHRHWPDLSASTITPRTGQATTLPLGPVSLRVCICMPRVQFLGARGWRQLGSMVRWGRCPFERRAIRCPWRRVGGCPPSHSAHAPSAFADSTDQARSVHRLLRRSLNSRRPGDGCPDRSINTAPAPRGRHTAAANSTAVGGEGAQGRRRSRRCLRRPGAAR